MAQRYVEIFEERNEAGKSKLSYFGFDKKMHDVGEADVNELREIVEALWNVIKSGSVEGGTVPTPGWVDAATVTNTLTNVTNTNAAARVAKGTAYEGELALSNSAKTYATCTVTMGGTDISSTALSSVTGAAHKKKVLIPNVTGNIVITATQST